MSALHRKRVFILGGGAALGAHQVGAMRLLEEEGVTPDAIVGSSIGVINASLYASGGVDNMAEAWLALAGGSFFRPSLRHNPFTGRSLVSVDRLAERVEQFIDFDKLLTSPLELSYILLNLSRGEGQFYSNRQARGAEELQQITRAGYSIPILFPPVQVRGEFYVDGGFAWNVPLLQAVEMGATEIVVLAVVATALPFRGSFGGIMDYAARVSDVLWRTLGNVGYVTTRIEDDGTYRGVPVTVVHPTEELAGFSLPGVFSTSRARSQRLMTAGYRDAKRELMRARRSKEAAPGPAPPQLEVEPAFRHEIT
ncbi:MAG: patatin-like phospholipase family protein [Myxococcota bacterium]